MITEEKTKTKKKCEKQKHRIVKRFILLGIVLALGICIAWSNYHVEIQRITYQSDRLPDGFDGCKIVQISDYHNTLGVNHNNRVIEMVRAEKPNYIFITGDSVDDHRTNIDKSANFIGELQKVAQCYVIYGNHEMALDAGTRLSFANKVEATGAKFLYNTSVTLARNSSNVTLCGLYDTYSFENNDYFGSGFNIVLDHFPEDCQLISDSAKKYGKSADLVFSGHAHGGLIGLPFTKYCLFAPGQGFFPTYTDGEYTVGNTKMIVSRGLGNSGYTFRLFDSFEINVCTLKK